MKPSNGTPAGGRADRGLRVAMVHLSDFRYDSRIQRQARALAERGDTVDLICLGEREELEVGAGRIRVHPVSCARPAGGAAAYLRLYPRFLAGALRRLTALELRDGYDLVEVHNMPDALTLAAVVPRLRRVPVILNMHDTFPELFATRFGLPLTHPLTRLLELEERGSARLADRIITVTEEASRRIQARGVGAGRTVVVMNSPDEQVFGSQRPPKSPAAAGSVRVLYHGGTASRFGVETLVRAVGLLGDAAPRITLRICASGSDRDRVAGLAAAVAPERIDVSLAPVAFGDIPAELEAAQIGVVPTLRDPFTELLLPVKLLEYVHMGLAVVASRLPGIEGYFSDADLRLVTPGDPGALAAAITDICANPQAARERASRAAGRLEAIAWKYQRRRYLGLVDDLTRRPAGWMGAILGAPARPETSAAHNGRDPDARVVRG